MKPNASNTKRRTIAYFNGSHGLLSLAGKPAFYQIRFDASVLEELISNLRAVADSDSRMWYTLTASSESLSRLRMYTSRTPDFELRASKCYLRGTLFRVSGKESANIDFSTDGALLLAERLREAKTKMREFVLLRLPNRKKDIVEFWPDIELEALPSDEHLRLRQGGETLAAQVWCPEDFSDWELQAGSDDSPKQDNQER